MAEVMAALAATSLPAMAAVRAALFPHLPEHRGSVEEQVPVAREEQVQGREEHEGSKEESMGRGYEVEEDSPSAVLPRQPKVTLIKPRVVDTKKPLKTSENPVAKPKNPPRNSKTPVVTPKTSTFSRGRQSVVTTAEEEMEDDPAAEEPDEDVARDVKSPEPPAKAATARAPDVAKLAVDMPMLTERVHTCLICRCVTFTHPSLTLSPTLHPPLTPPAGARARTPAPRRGGA